MLYDCKIIGIVSILVMLSLTACSRNIEESNNQLGNYTKESSNHLNNDTKELSSSLDSDESSKQVYKEYFASNDDGSLNFFDDYDTAILLCNDAFDTFINAVKHDGNADFSTLIESPILREYMQYRVDNHIYGYDNSNHRFFIMEVDFNDDYVFIKGVLTTYSGDSSSSAEGITYFLIKNINGKLVIVDWYWDVRDSPDITLRDEFSIENNLDYWEEPEKYTELLEKIRE